MTRAGIVRAKFPRRPRNGWKVFGGSAARAAAQAPRDLTILRGEVWERIGKKRPDCLLPVK